MTTRTTFKKRQKEMLRLEKQREKTAKRLARKMLPKQIENIDPETGLEIEPGIDPITGEPLSGEPIDQTPDTAL